ncbi:hypothetical protein M3J07_003206 [Ascochyta lentis]
MKLQSIAILAIAQVAIARHGDPILVAFQGTSKFGDLTLDSTQRDIHDSLLNYCKGIGGHNINGGFDSDRYNFKFDCHCAHGDTKLPYPIRENWGSALATQDGSGECQ